MNNKSRILIVDDNTSFRNGMRALLSIQPDMEVIGEAMNGYTAIEFVARLQPGLVLLDECMPGITGSEVARQIKEQWPHTKVILLTMYSDHRNQAIGAGADAFLTKGTSPEHLLAVIREIVKD